MNDLLLRESGHPPTDHKKKKKLHLDTYMRTYINGHNKTKQSKRTQNCGSNFEELIRSSDSDVSAQL